MYDDVSLPAPSSSLGRWGALVVVVGAALVVVVGAALVVVAVGDSTRGGSTGSGGGRAALLQEVVG